MKLWKYTFGFLTLILMTIIIAICQLPDNNLHIIACDVGQGDAILIAYKETQILTDGGPDKSVLECLGRYMPFYDREIELVISTHPDSDHATGLISVLQGYKVDEILINPIDPGTQVYKALESEVGGRGVGVVNPMSGMQLGLGLIHLDILGPTGDLFNKLQVQDPESNLSKYSISRETNLYSIVYRLSFKDFSGLLPGDIPPEVSDSLANGWTKGNLNYIKIPHHGSINGLTENLIKVTIPNMAIISVGKNSWGFPRPEILEILNRHNVQVLRTDLMGDIEVITDGSAYWVK